MLRTRKPPLKRRPPTTTSKAPPSSSTGAASGGSAKPARPVKAGKANQFYLRGFNLDHGTDFRITIDGMLVNQRSHAHGQGWSDMNFLIPELVTRMDYHKGPFYADEGDFATAGAVAMTYANRLPRGIAAQTLGPNRYRRTLLADSPEFGDGRLLYALELVGNNGPYTNPERYRKNNAVLRYSEGNDANGFNISAMAYSARWNATDQIPLRAVQGGSLSRFDAVDPTDGGRASRYSLSGAWQQRDAEGFTRVNAYLMRRSLQLFSNFTYFDRRPGQRRPVLPARRAGEHRAQAGAWLEHADRRPRERLHHRPAARARQHLEPAGEHPRAPGAVHRAQRPRAAVKRGPVRREHYRMGAVAAQHRRPACGPVPLPRRVGQPAELGPKERPDLEPQVRPGVRPVEQDRAVPQHRPRLSQQRRARGGAAGRSLQSAALSIRRTRRAAGACAQQRARRAHRILPWPAEFAVAVPAAL